MRIAETHKFSIKSPCNQGNSLSTLVTSFLTIQARGEVSSFIIEGAASVKGAVFSLEKIFTPIVSFVAHLVNVPSALF